MNHKPVIFNGVNGSTGDYLLAPLTRQELAQTVLGKTVAGDEDRERVLTRGRPAPGVDPKDLATSGWGAVFAQDAGPELRDALDGLLRHRREQATTTDERYYREYTGERGLRPGESMRKWLARQGAGPGPAHPGNVPYYLLIVGDPQKIPLDFQFELSTQYAVGRIHFDTSEGYSRYACNVVDAERSGAGRPPQAVLFGVHNPDDRATSFTTKRLMKPLVEKLGNATSGWKVTSILGEGATKARLSRLLGGAETPALLFTASHGMGFDHDDPRFPHRVGAILCQDWPGPREWHRRIPEEHYFSAEDVSEDADLRGLVSFHFACFSAGMPHQDSFAHESGGKLKILGPRAFFAHLPQRLLSHPKGGALAVIGHFDRARGFSFIWPGAGSQPQTFAAVLQRLMEGGVPVGEAARYLAERHADISVSLNGELRKAHCGHPVDEVELADLWTAYVDARSYVVLGDPAVRLKLARQDPRSAP